MSRSALALILTALVVVAACGDSGDATSEPTAAPSLTPTQEPTPAATPTDATAEPTPAESTQPSEAPSDGPSATPTAAAAACTGTEQNQEFFASVAAAVDWPVLCLADDGWVVTTGSYSLRGGGRIEIGYRGPGGATVELREGYICEGEAEPCAPQGAPVRDVAFGELGNAQLIELEGGSFAVVADPDANPTWILVSSGLTGDGLADLAGGFATVGG